MLEEQQRAVVDPGKPRAEASLVAESALLKLDVVLLLLPIDAEGRIGEHVVEGVLASVGTAGVAVLPERVPQDDPAGVIALEEHVGLADCP